MMCQSEAVTFRDVTATLLIELKLAAEGHLKNVEFDGSRFEECQTA